MTRKQQTYKNVQKWPRQLGKAAHLRFLQGERLTRAEASRRPMTFVEIIFSWESLYGLPQRIAERIWEKLYDYK